jgi:uncharacterized protein (DUF433 family)
MSQGPEGDRIPLCADAIGDLRVGKSGVLLDVVVHAYNGGATPEMIVQSYPSLQLSDVYAVIGYYLSHRGDVAEYLRQREKRAHEIRVPLDATAPGTSGARPRRPRGDNPKR